MTKTAVKAEPKPRLYELVREDALVAVENLFRARRRVQETSGDKAVVEYLDQASEAMRRIHARRSFAAGDVDPVGAWWPDGPIALEDMGDTYTECNEALAMDIKSIARDVTDQRRQMENSLARPPQSNSFASHHEASRRYNELLDKVRDLLGPEHSQLGLDLDSAVGNYSGLLVQSAVRDHGMQILEIISGSDFEYKFIEEC